MIHFDQTTAVQPLAGDPDWEDRQVTTAVAAGV